MNLQQEIEALKNQFYRDLPEQTKIVIQSVTKKLKQSDIIERCCKVGDKAPDFSLPNIRGERIQSSDILAKGPLVLTFYRGGW